MARVRQYITMVRYVDVPNANLKQAANTANSLPINSEDIPAETAIVVRDWEYVPDSDDFEDMDGNPIDV